MSPDSDYFSFYYPGESTYADGPPPESFDNEFGNVEFDWSPEQLDKLFSPSCVTVPVITTPSTLTYSTESASQSSYSYTFSDYSFPSDPSTGVDGMHDSMSIYSNMFYNGPPSFGPLPPSPPPHPARALLDNGTSADYQVSFGVSPDDISPPVQLSVTPVAPAIPQVMSDTQEPIAPRKPYKCPRCPFASARNYNLKTHIETHDKEKSKRFPCGVCKSRFSRKHDLRRHKITMHGRSSSVHSGSSLDSAISTSDVPEDIMALFQGV